MFSVVSGKGGAAKPLAGPAFGGGLAAPPLGTQSTTAAGGLPMRAGIGISSAINEYNQRMI